ncbi:MAG: DUF177 domain-containing protein [Kiritimatiellae bacterium]|nr:DUF177 domain-containing protein [Kiritimatiellia bacterium]
MSEDYEKNLESVASARPVGAALQAASQGRLIIDVARLDEGGEDFNGEIPIDQLDLDPDDLLFRPRSGLRYKLRVTLLDGILFASGRAEEDFECTCVRCAEDFPWTACDDEVEISIENAAADSFIDLTDSLRECIILSFPSNPLCREDCKGLCQHCGKNLNKEACECAQDGDGRWGALDGLEME